MRLENITIPIEDIDNIFHISDIHIRNTKRHDEYLSVFDKLYSEIKHTNSINCVCGDIVHTKTQMSPELIQITSDFFINLSRINPTFVITGNHDTNLSNRNRLDALEPIINNIQLDSEVKSNLYYLKESGIYTINNSIDLVVFSVLDGIEKYNEMIDYYKEYYSDNNRKSYAMYHGTVKGAVTDLGYKLAEEKITTNMFMHFDHTLLGDIHLQQTLK